MHLKRTEMPKEWPIARKGSKYIAVATHAKTKSLPLLFIVRDILKLARTRKEVEYMTRNKEVKINNKARKEDTYPVQVFDTIQFEKTGKNYRLIISNRKFKLEEVSAKEAERKVVKIVGKKLLGGKKIQMNLQTGENFLSNEKFFVGDSVILNTKQNKIEKVLSLKEGANVEVIVGKHAGQKGKLKTIETLARQKVYHIKLNDKEAVLPFKAILVVE